MSLYALLTNNQIINRLLIIFKVDGKKELSAGHWKVFKYNSNKSIQQNAGFSHTLEVEQAIEIVKSKLTFTLSKNLSEGNNVLDFGCGPGIYMQLFNKQYNVIGIDVSKGMIEHASQHLPNNKFYHGNFITLPIHEKFKAIYSISVLEYVPVSQIDLFFKKCYDLLDDKGIIFIQYPHALSKNDLYFPDRNYINYSPAKITKVASRYFKVIENKQSFDERETCIYDKQPYKTDSKTFKNGYLLIGQK